MAEYVNELPPVRRPKVDTKHHWWAVAEKAKARPGVWLRVGDDINFAHRRLILNGDKPAFRDGLWDAETRRNPNLPNPQTRGFLYLKYLGPSDPS